MTISAVSAGQAIEPDWGNAVADQLNWLPARMQGGDQVSTPNGSNVHTITFPVAFSGVPVLGNCVVRNSGSSSQWVVNLLTISATAFTFTVFLDGVIYSPSRSINWCAVLFPS